MNNNLNRQLNPAYPHSQLNMNMNMAMGSNGVNRMDLNEDTPQSPDMGNHALAEQARDTSTKSLDYNGLHLYNMQGMQNIQGAMHNIQNGDQSGNINPILMNEFKNITYPQDLQSAEKTM